MTNKKAAKVNEHTLQLQAEELCNVLGIRFFRIPDKLLAFLKLYAPVWVRVFVARYFAGVPDMMLFKQIEGNRNEVLFLEIKTETGTLSPSQKKWHNGLNVIVTHGWDETERIIKQFYKN